MIDRLIKRLTDAYQKKPNSNLAKLLGLITGHIDEIKENLERIEVWRSIDHAEGQTLDDIGRDLGQYRGNATDEIYRILLKSKTARDMSDGSTNTIINVLSMAIDADPSEIGISETWLDADNPEPAGINIIQVPIRRLNEVGMNSAQFAQFIAASVAAGVAVKSISLEGTFEFGGNELAQEENKGFADIDMTIGGYFGALYTSDSDQGLPM